jgi:hypothetical protein
MGKTPDENYADDATAERANATLKRMLQTPPKLHKDSKLGKRKGKPDD